MTLSNRSLSRLGAAVLAALACGPLWAAPQVSRLTPPSELFASGRAAPVIARFLPGQRFDLQATLRPDAPERSIVSARFEIDGRPVDAPVSIRRCDSGCAKGVPTQAVIATARAMEVQRAGVHEFGVVATQDDGQTVTARGNFEVVGWQAGGRTVRNVIVLLGDGMGAAQRTAARIVAGGYAQGKVAQPLAMDLLPVTGLVRTASLNSVVTDSSPGMTAYVSGNKNNNNEEGVFPDDTVDPFDNPRIEYLSEYLHRTQGKALGIVTTADVFDATPAGNAVHSSNRGAGTGIVDQFLDDRHLSGLTVLMGGGRKWFLPATEAGSARSDKVDYVFPKEDPHVAGLVSRWGASPGALDRNRDLIGDFRGAGFRYAATRTELDAVDTSRTDRLLGLFALSNMNVALDKIEGRRRRAAGSTTPGVVDDYGFPDQPMLDEMAAKALEVLARQPRGFVLMVEGASIDKQAHNMDTERWMLDTLEFDRTVALARRFAETHPDTLVIVTADHECSGAALIGGSRLTDARLVEQIGKGDSAANLRDAVVGVYEQAGFPRYRIAADGYPETTDIDHRLLVGYGANPDRREDWRTSARPLQDSQQPMVRSEPMSTYPATPFARKPGGFVVTGQVPGESAVHTATDIPLSAFGPGAYAFTGSMDNTDVFFRIAQSVVRGVVTPDLGQGRPAPRRAR
ncbi:alkaline phosphatase [Sphaerotilus uruguayifluvii]|uniref:Alkaline phosphatase n=1 Tax=Sphaerotilus uruguayifluvii TaxID=2735897 RepID=A0ABX2FZ17_9BURK|nr:alkaline phosphatase [Leptothrix sp. C29]NRT55030.1 alkaline phosphatase [Leptothrix sp. C29]